MPPPPPPPGPHPTTPPYGDAWAVTCGVGWQDVGTTRQHMQLTSPLPFPQTVATARSPVTRCRPQDSARKTANEFQEKAQKAAKEARDVRKAVSQLCRFKPLKSPSRRLTSPGKRMRWGKGRVSILPQAGLPDLGPSPLKNWSTLGGGGRRCKKRTAGTLRRSSLHYSVAPCVTFRRVVAPLRGPGQSPVLPFACCVGSLRSVGRCGRCSCWCRFRVRGAPPYLPKYEFPSGLRKSM